MPKIELSNITVIYRNAKKKSSDIIALDNVSTIFENGKFNVIIGSSGSGKTTLIRSVIGLLSYSGNMYFDGIDAESMKIEERNIGYVSQEYALYPHIDVFDNISFSLKLKGAPREEIIETVTKIAKELGIYECLSRKPKYLSGGQQQRVALARALAKNPTTYVFDEPLSNLDPKIRENIRALIKEQMAKHNATVLYVTHDIHEAFALADRIYVVDEGKIIQEGTPREIKDTDNKQVLELIKAGFENDHL